jgi:hypothetical protein
MKSFRWSVIPLILLAFGLNSLFSGCDAVCVNGEGNTVIVSRQVGNFSEINFGTEGTVYVTQGSETSLTIEAQQNVIDDLITEVHGNELEIYNDHCLRDHVPMIIRITTPDISALIMSGSGDMILTGKVNTGSLSLVISGSGSIQAQDTVFASAVKLTESGSGFINVLAECENATTVISGSGEVTLNGHATDQHITISGSGGFYGFGFVTDATTVEVSGSGLAEVFANLMLNVSISGSGSVYYKGNPSVTANISGSGEVVNAN